MSTWIGTLNEENIERVAAMLRERLYDKTFAIASVGFVESARPSLDMRTGCSLESDWTDGSKEQVRVMESDSGRKWIGFSAGHYLWSFDPAPGNTHGENRRFTYFAFDYNGVKVEFRSPSGDLHYHLFRIQGSV